MRLVECTVATDDVDGFVARLGAIGERHGAAVQAFDARYVVDRTHLERAVALADRARERGAAVARERSVEVLLYAAGRRQIDRALTMGVDRGPTPAVVLVDGTGDGEAAAADAVRGLDPVTPATTLGDYDPDRVRSFFDVSDAELAAAAGDLAALVHERVALLAVER
ncbi:MAG: KEOPS complex subunit Cgi121 [Haloferacaceae archaeon]